MALLDMKGESPNGVPSEGIPDYVGAEVPVHARRPDAAAAENLNEHDSRAPATQSVSRADALVCVDVCTHDAKAWVESYRALRCKKDRESALAAQNMRASVGVATLAAARAFIAGSVVPSPRVLHSASSHHPVTVGKCLQQVCVDVVADRLDLQQGDVLVVPFEPQRRSVDGHLEAEVLRRTTLGLLAPLPQPALAVVSLLRGMEKAGYPFLAPEKRREVTLLRLPQFCGDFSVAGWQATRHLRQAMERIVAAGVGQTVVFHGLWGLGRGTRRKKNDQVHAVRVFVRALSGLPIKVRVQVPDGVAFPSLQAALDAECERELERSTCSPRHSRPRVLQHPYHL